MHGGAARSDSSRWSLARGFGRSRGDQDLRVNDSFVSPKAIPSVDRYNELRLNEFVKGLPQSWNSDSKLVGRRKAERHLRPGSARQVGHDARLIKEFRKLVVEHREEFGAGFWSTDKVQHAISLCAEATAQERQQSFVSSHRSAQS